MAASLPADSNTPSMPTIVAMAVSTFLALLDARFLCSGPGRARVVSRYSSRRCASAGIESMVAKAVKPTGKQEMRIVPQMSSIEVRANALDQFLYCGCDLTFVLPCARLTLTATAEDFNDTVCD